PDDPSDLYSSAPSKVDAGQTTPSANSAVTGPNMCTTRLPIGMVDDGNSLKSPFSAQNMTGNVDAMVQQALANKDFVAALFRSMSGNTADNSISTSPAVLQDGWAKSVAHFSANGTSPSPFTAAHATRLPSTPVAQIAPSSSSPPVSMPMPLPLPTTPVNPNAQALPLTPVTPTKPKPRGRPKGKAKGKTSSSAAQVTRPSPPGISSVTLSSSPTSVVPASSPAVPSLQPASPNVAAPVPNATSLTPSNGPTATPRMSMRDLAVLLPTGFQACDEPNSAGYNKGSIRLCPPLPDKCEVNNPLLHDPLLEDTYAGLVNLKMGRFSSWTSNIGRGQVVFSTWVSKTPSMNPNTAFSIITFTQSGRYINGSRLSPLEVQLREVRQNNTLRYNVYRGNVPAIAMSCGYLWESHLTQPKSYGLPQKMVSLVLHKQEWERLVGFTCMIFNLDVIAAQVAQSALQFATRGDWDPNFVPQQSSNSSSSLHADVDDHMFTHTQSPATDPASSSTSQNESMSLSANSRISVFDARGTDFNFQEDMDKLYSLPRWEGEIPRGSFVVVGYTLSAYHPNQKWNLATNLRWAVVVGVPE
ncbi:hypothetical protein CVT24_006384, partial [Panaeolus cyanescens]